MADANAKDRRTVEKKTVSKPATAGKDKALSTDDLDKVSGGINPQPLPPGMSRIQQ